jgi:hypothetical protein
MIKALRDLFKQRSIRISRENERAFHFYAFLVLSVLYLLDRLQGGG